jgi:hypothetical protein
MDEISDAEFEETAIARLKAEHYHIDGSEAVLSPVEESGMERRIIEEEKEWRQKTQQTATPYIGNSSDEQKPLKKIDAPEAVEVKKEKKFVASCNCGRIFSSTFSANSNPAQADVKVKAYDASGASKTYSVSGPQQADYKVSGDTGRDYSQQ